MQLLNRTSATILSDNIHTANSFAEKTIGLLRDTTPRAMYFRTRWGVHTVGMKFPIDVIVCDRNFQVKKFTTMRPHRFFFWNPMWLNIFELPAESIAKSKTAIGDTLEITH